MTDRPPFVSFLSDYGRVDEFVGVCHGVMLDVTPDLRIVDITHDIAPFDVRAGALALVRAVQYLPDGVVLAVVDPGVGTERRCIAVEVEGGYLVGPDNGLLAPAVAMLGRPGPDRRARQSRVSAAGPGPDVRGARHHGARRRVSRRAACRSTHWVRPSTRPGWRPGSCRCPKRTTTARSRARCSGSTATATASSTSRPSSSLERGVAPGGFVGVTIGGDERRAHWVTRVRRRQAVRAGVGRRLVRDVCAGLRPTVGRGGAQAAGGQDVDAGRADRGTLMRWGTSLVLVVLLC